MKSCHTSQNIFSFIFVKKKKSSSVKPRSSFSHSLTPSLLPDALWAFVSVVWLFLNLIIKTACASAQLSEFYINSSLNMWNRKAIMKKAIFVFSSLSKNVYCIANLLMGKKGGGELWEEINTQNFLKKLIE